MDIHWIKDSKLYNDDLDDKKFHEQFFGNWDSSTDYIFARDRVMKWLQRKEISEQEAQILMRLEYTIVNGERRFIG